ncbi:MAG: DNA-binding protein [Clostridia bacterium]
MKLKTGRLLGLWVLVLLLPMGACAQADSVGSVRLIENAKQYDGQQIVFEGEAVGDVLQRTDHAWLCLSDESNSSISIWTPRELAAQVTMVGDYSHHGDELRVSGVFHRACAEHGGDMDIHADAAEVTARGSDIVHEVSVPLVISAGALLLIALTLVGFVIVKHRGVKG